MIEQKKSVEHVRSTAEASDCLHTFRRWSGGRGGRWLGRGADLGLVQLVTSVEIVLSVDYQNPVD